MTDWDRPESEPGGIVKLTGAAKSAENESLSRRDFIAVKATRMLLTKAGLGCSLLEEYGKAKVAQETNLAMKSAAEAAEIAARRDEMLAKADGARQDATAKFFENVDNIVGLPDEAKQKLQLAKLIEQNPTLAAQLSKVVGISDALRVTKSVAIDLLPRSEQVIALSASDTLPALGNRIELPSISVTAEPATVTVSAPDPIVELSSVAISPEPASAHASASVTFEATISGRSNVTANLSVDKPKSDESL